MAVYETTFFSDIPSNTLRTSPIFPHFPYISTKQEGIDRDYDDCEKNDEVEKEVDPNDLEKLDDSSTDDDSDGSKKDELYKQPPAGYESGSESGEDDEGRRVRAAKGKGKQVSPSSRKGPSTSRPGRQPNKSRPARDPSMRPAIAEYVSDADTDHEDIVFEYEFEELHTPVSLEDEGNKPHWPEFDEQYGFGEGRFDLGTRFATIERFKKVVKDSFITEGRELVWIKNDKERVRVGCKSENCPWIAHLSYNKQLQCFQVKSYRSEHTCARDLGSNAADQHWISKKVEKKMITHPHMNTHEAIDFLREEFDLVLHPKMVYRAVKEAKDKIMGNEIEQYGNLRDYLMEIHRSNPRSTALLDVIFQPQAPATFDKMYICFDACKMGFKSGCRPLIHLDGAFLKTYHGGQLLSAVTQDANNQFYVIAYAVARSESK
ncbi:uncharacterized protein LOC130967277 [Arachis stenosperma]|uniref:uncharacterized protein LOC130967277 n=1 Tax=Arachis stenosperma TaxID=217475 RepID=UPI0025AD2031|nr:uncharacterized protein LOC130967277 [Arachis stenosperma]